MKSCFLICLTLVSITFSINAQPVKSHGKLKVDGVRLVDEHNKPVVLRGVSFGWHTFQPRFYTAGSVKWLAEDWGATVIRAAMGVEPRNGYIENAQGSTEKVKAVVDAAIKQGVYVIIDWHSHNIKLKEAKEFFAEMAKTYGKTPNVIYEIFNEPDQESWADVKVYSTEIIATIRAIDPDNIILIGNTHWDQDVNVAADDPIKGVSNVMYTLHFYAATHKQQLRDRGDYALKKGLPLFISESAGMEATGDGPLNDEEWKKWINWAEERKISWVTWSVSDKDETCSVLLPTASATGNWKETDLKESGKKTRAMLRAYANKK
jgi:endoglucanase